MEQKIKQRLEEITKLRQIAQIQIDALDLEYNALCVLRDRTEKEKIKPNHEELIFTLK